MKTRLPPLPPPSDPRFLDAVYERLAAHTGQRGLPIDRMVTFRDLVDSGLAVAGPGAGGGGGGGGGAIVGPVGGFPNMTIPPVVANFRANGAYSAILIWWDSPRYSNHSHTEIVRASVNDIGQSQLIGTSPASSYVDVVGGDFHAFYWARHISTSGVAGPWSKPSEASTPTDVEWMLEKLTGEITESQLYKDLQDRIDLIDGPDSLFGSVAERLKAEAQARAAGMQDRINEIQAEAQARIDGLIDEALAREQSIALAEQTLREWVDEDSAVASLLTDLVVALGGTAAGAIDHIVAETDGALAISSRFHSLESRAGDIEDGLSTTASVTYVDEAISDESSARALALSALEAIVTDEDTGLSSKASHTDLVDAKADIFGAEVSEFTNISAEFSGISSELSSKASATDLVDAKADIFGAEVSSFTEISAEFDSIENSLNTKASVTYVNNAVAGESSARASALSALEAVINDEETGLSSKASQTDLVDAKADIFGAGVSSFTNISAALDDVADDLSSLSGGVSSLQQTVVDETQARSEAIEQVYAVSGAKSENKVNPLTVEGYTDGWNLFVTLGAYSGEHGSYTVGGRSIVGARSIYTSGTQRFSDWFDIDPDGIYEIAVSCWVGTDGRSYFGMSSNDKDLSTAGQGLVRNISASGALGASLNGNPYWNNDIERGKWVRLVAYIFGSSADHTAIQPGQNVTIPGFKLEPGQVKARVRLNGGFAMTGASHTTYWTGASVKRIDGTLTAAVQTQAEAISDLQGNVSASYTIKVNAQGAIAGIGLMATEGEGSEVAIQANRFYIVEPGESYDSPGSLVPFIVDGGKVWIDEAGIRNASITVAQIKQGFFDEMTAAQGSITDAHLDIANIFNAIVGNEIKSSNYSAGSSGFRIIGGGLQSGNAEFNSVVMRGLLRNQSANRYIDMRPGVTEGDFVLGNVEGQNFISFKKEADYNNQRILRIRGDIALRNYAPGDILLHSNNSLVEVRGMDNIPKYYDSSNVIRVGMSVNNTTINNYIKNTAPTSTSSDIGTILKETVVSRSGTVRVSCSAYAKPIGCVFSLSPDRLHIYVPVIRMMLIKRAGGEKIEIARYCDVSFGNTETLTNMNNLPFWYAARAVKKLGGTANVAVSPGDRICLTCKYIEAIISNVYAQGTIPGRAASSRTPPSSVKNEMLARGESISLFVDFFPAETSVL